MHWRWRQAQLDEAQQHLADLQNPTRSAIELAQASLDEATSNLADLKADRLRMM